VLADSQNLVPDPFVELGALARVTSRLGLGTGIVNPLTRHPAVVASAIATVQRLTDAPVVLGVGRGDSSLHGVGLAAPTTARLAEFLAAVRGYLRGEEVRIGGATSRLSWIEPGQAAVPSIELAATGPRTIALAATGSDRVMLTLGASVERIGTAIEHARSARADAGLDPDQLRVGAYLNIGCHDDLSVARDLVRGSTAIFAHFLSMTAAAAADLTGNDVNVVSEIGHRYDENRHGLSTASHAGALDDEFIDEFAVVGSAQRCQQRLAELIDLGRRGLVGQLAAETSTTRCWLVVARRPSLSRELQLIMVTRTNLITAAG
jgi:5,10-methylenetetrahydromethanopterin reductase